MPAPPVIHAPDGTVLAPLERIPTYIGFCCREWPLATMTRGRCGLCGDVPVYLRRDTHHDDTPVGDATVGDLIADELIARGWTLNQFAVLLNWSTDLAAGILAGHEQITATRAEDIGRAFGTSADMWLNLARSTA